MRENGGVMPTPIQENLVAPSWLKGVEKAEFGKLVDENRAAGVSMRAVDAELYAELAVTQIAFRKERDGNERRAFLRCMSQLRKDLNIGAGNRVRVGIKDHEKNTVVPKEARLIRMPGGM
jgi:hypothetical protein